MFFLLQKIKLVPISQGKYIIIESVKKAEERIAEITGTCENNATKSSKSAVQTAKSNELFKFESAYKTLSLPASLTTRVLNFGT